MDRSLPTEAQEQLALIQWMNIKNIEYFAVPNGGSRHKLEAINLKRQGVKAGVSDIVVLLDNKILFVELKRRKKLLKSGKLSTSHTSTSQAQTDFISKVSEYPYAQGKVCYGWEEAKEFIQSHKEIS